MNKTMTKKLFSLFFISLLVAFGLGNWTAIHAEEPDFSFAAIASNFNTSNDGSAFIPSNLETSQNPVAEGDRAIIGADNRIQVTTSKYPWSAIGRVEQVDRRGNVLGWCTGTLIGKDTVVTNAHCLIDEETQQPTRDSLRFKPNYLDGGSIDKANIIEYQYGTNDVENNPDEDWAIVKLDKPLGDTYGHMGWRSLDFSNSSVLSMAQGKLKLAGYSGDFPEDDPGSSPGVHDGCSITSIEEGQLLHNCDTNPGASGSALFGKFNDGTYNIVGLHAGSAMYTNGRVINRAVQVSRWMEQAREMQ